MRRTGILGVTIVAAALMAGLTVEPPIAEPDDVPVIDAEDGSTTAEPGIPPAVAARIASMKGGAASNDTFPSFDTVAKDYEKVATAADDASSFYGVWKRERDAQILLELPRKFDGQKLFIAYTIAGGVETAGVQAGDMYAYWKRYDRRLALIQPNYAVRSTGDAESRRGKERVFTDRVILDVPIVTMGKGGGPVIDGDALFAGRAAQFFGGRVLGANPSLATIAKAKAFPQNVELAWEMPLAGGQLGTLHYSIRMLPNPRGYQPREADTRIGYFTTTFRDIGHPERETPYVRYINRWNLEKRDPGLKQSPPKEPIIFYLEHTIPVRYRRWVREGVLEWNKAFERVGIVDAIEVYQQDSQTGAYMDIDPEDARYNFILWTNSNMGFAIGPSRVHPETGQILDADVVMDEGFISGWVRSFNQAMPEIALAHADPQMLAWLDSRPQWDPRVRLVPPAQRPHVLQQLALRRVEHFGRPFAGHDATTVDHSLLGDNRYDGLFGRVSQVNGACECALHAGMELAVFRMCSDFLHELSTPASPDRHAIAIDPVTGTWEGQAEIPGRVLEFTMDLRLEADATVTGTVDAMMFKGYVNGTFEPESRQLRLTIPIPDGPTVELQLTVGDDTMEGTGTVEGSDISITARRTGTGVEPDAEPQASDSAVDPDADYTSLTDDEAGDAIAADEAVRDVDDAAKRDVASEQAGMLDGVPESFIGPLLRSIVLHEVGHTLGLRHNFKASTIYSLERINGDDRPETITGSVMDYNPINVNYQVGAEQGDWAMMTIGPYDYWAIEYGYGPASSLDDVLGRVNDPELAYGTDEDSWGSDPRIVTFDLGENPLDYADMQFELVQHLRGEILDRIVKKGDNWSKARDAYELLLSRHLQAVSIAGNWIGGTETYRGIKGDPQDGPSVTPVPAAQQRRAFEFVLDSTFDESAFGLDAELLSRMTVDKWFGEGDFSSLFEDPAWPIHERILGVQATAMSLLLNPTTLARVYDNEMRIDPDEDAFTLAEVMTGVTRRAWSELDEIPRRKATTRKPAISSIRRNLQREHLDRLIDLTLPNGMFGVAAMPVSNLAVFMLRDLKGRLDETVSSNRARLDVYTLAHLTEASVQIEKALDAQYIYNTDDMNSGSGGIPFIMFGAQESAVGR